MFIDTWVLVVLLLIIGALLGALANLITQRDWLKAKYSELLTLTAEYHTFIKGVHSEYVEIVDKYNTLYSKFKNYKKRENIY